LTKGFLQVQPGVLGGPLLADLTLKDVRSYWRAIWRLLKPMQPAEGGWGSAVDTFKPADVTLDSPPALVTQDPPHRAARLSAARLERPQAELSSQLLPPWPCMSNTNAQLGGVQGRNACVYHLRLAVGSCSPVWHT